MPSSITQLQITDLIKRSKTECVKLGSKTTVLVLTLPNGFELVESSSCVDPANYDHEMGRQICLQRVQERLWMLEGYRLQCELAEDRADRTHG